MRFLQDFITKITARESDDINKARVLMSLYLVLAYCFLGVILVVAYAYTGHTSQFIRACLITLFASFFLVILYFFDAWRIISHGILMLITVMGVWANLIFYVHGINAATLQFVWLASALGFYMHGSKWGWFYTIVNIIPVVIDTVYTQKSYFFFGDIPQQVYKPVYVFILLFDFLVIAFLHYFFFRAFHRNIVSLTEAKNQLNEINEKLSKKVDEINELSNARMSFLSTMSHELRTPLNGVIGLTNVLLLQEPRKDQEETLSVLKFSAENLLTLVNDILDFNKLESEMVELERTTFSLANFISNIYASTRLKAAEKRLDFKFEIAEELKGLTLLGDPTRLTQVLLNLLNNAIKFTEKGSVKLICSALTNCTATVKIRFEIVDTGIGIEDSQQKRIFEEFVQASTSINRNFGGTGLGLSIVKKVLALHHTEMKIESHVGQGTRFTFEIDFPYETSLTPESNFTDIPETSLDLSRYKILVVEDNAINVMVIKKTLNRIGVHPDVAENGQVAVEMVEAKDYDLILMDLYMPVLDGYEATKKIRALADVEKANVTIVALTATVNSRVLEDVLGIGMNGYLCKPFHPNDLFDELRKHLA